MVRIELGKKKGHRYLIFYLKFLVTAGFGIMTRSSNVGNTLETGKYRKTIEILVVRNTKIWNTFNLSYSVQVRKQKFIILYTKTLNILNFSIFTIIVIMLPTAKEDYMAIIKNPLAIIKG